MTVANARYQRICPRRSTIFSAQDRNFPEMKKGGHQGLKCEHCLQSRAIVSEDADMPNLHGVPQPDETIVASGCNSCPCRREGHRVDPAHISRRGLHSVKEGSGLHVPHRDIVSTRDEPRAIEREGSRTASRECLGHGTASRIEDLNIRLVGAQHEIPVGRKSDRPRFPISRDHKASEHIATIDVPYADGSIGAARHELITIGCPCDGSHRAAARQSLCERPRIPQLQPCIVTRCDFLPARREGHRPDWLLLCCKQPSAPPIPSCALHT